VAPLLGTHTALGFVTTTDPPAAGHLLPTYTWACSCRWFVDGFVASLARREQLAGAHEIDAKLRDARPECTRCAWGLPNCTAAEQLAVVRERLAFAEQEVAQARSGFCAGVAGNADVISAAVAESGTHGATMHSRPTRRHVSLARAIGASNPLMFRADMAPLVSRAAPWRPVFPVLSLCACYDC
jgi:hypothetical protein